MPHIQIDDIESIVIPTDINALMMESALEISGIEIECSDISMEFNDASDMVNTLIDELITNEDSKLLRMEEAVAYQESMWTKLASRIQELIKSIKNLWIGFITWLKKQAYIIDYYWYKDRMNLIAPGIQNLPQGIKINLTYYKVQSPVDMILQDTKECEAILSQMYTAANDYIGELMNPSVEKTGWFRQMISGEISPRDKAKLLFEDNYKSIKDLCNLNNLALEDITGASVKNSIYEKYFGAVVPMKQELDPKSVVADVSDATILNPTVMRPVEQLCNTVSNGSSKCDVSLSRLKHFVDTEANEAKVKEAKRVLDLKVGSAIASLRTTLSISNAIGSSFWSIFLHIRVDVKRCVNLYTKYAK